LWRLLKQRWRVPRSTASTEDQLKERAEPPANHSARQRHLYAAGPSVPSAIVSQPSAGVCKPPPINRFSDRVTQCLHSFPLNAGLGNNPANKDLYVGSCANN
jgi:hypothetical protein